MKTDIIQEIIRPLITTYTAGLAYSKDPYDLERFEQIEVLTKRLLQMVSDHQSIDLKKYETGDGYSTPKIDVRAVIWRDSQLLLVQESDNGWALPGGWCDLGESASEAAVRETREETGYIAKAVRLLALLNKDKDDSDQKMIWTIYKAFFECEVIGGHKELSIETKDVRYFSFNEIPPLSAGRTTKRQIELLFKILRERKLEAEFD